MVLSGGKKRGSYTRRALQKIFLEKNLSKKKAENLLF